MYGKSKNQTFRSQTLGLNFFSPLFFNVIKPSCSDTCQSSTCGDDSPSFPFPFHPSLPFPSLLRLPNSSSQIGISSSMMADTSALCFFPFSSIPSVSRQWETNSLLFSSSKSSVSPPRSSRLLRFPAKASDSVNYSGDDSFNFFPWSRGESGMPLISNLHLLVLIYYLV